MEYNDNFKKLIEIALENNQYIGLGDPNAKILFIGKEAGLDPENKENKKFYLSNALAWKANSDIFNNSYFPETDSPLRNYNHTWQKFQKLHDSILQKDSPLKYEITFVENVFTTELSNMPYKNTKGAKKQSDFKQNLNERKAVFLNSDFFKKFPIVVIFAKDKLYIQNIGEGATREIDNIFDVVFIRKNNSQIPNNDFWIHHSKDKTEPRLIIHTRQLTNGAPKELIDDIGEEIRNFALANSINLMIKNE